MENEGRQPRGENKLGWQVRNCRTPFECAVFDVCEDELEVNGHQQNYAYLVSPPAVIIVPVTENGEIITLRQYRYPVDEWCTEVPAGGTHDTGNESLEQVARKELLQETGGTTDQWTEVGAFYTSPSVTTERCTVFLAEAVRISDRPRREATEEIEVDRRAARDIVQMARDGRIHTAPCALAVLMCEPILRQRGLM